MNQSAKKTNLKSKMRIKTLLRICIPYLHLFFIALVPVLLLLDVLFLSTRYNPNKHRQIPVDNPATSSKKEAIVASSAMKEKDGLIDLSKSSAIKNPIKTSKKKTPVTTKKLKNFPLLSNPTAWPPLEDRLYPDMKLTNQDGTKTRLSELAGNIIIVQHVAMNCPASQALSGANYKDKKAFGLCFPNRKVTAFSESLQMFTGINSKNAEIVFVQILFYNMDGKAPSPSDARKWAKHFNLKTSQNQYVLIANEKMINNHSKLLIPGFHLIDRAFILRSDSAGPLPKRNLYNHFFPKLCSLIPSYRFGEYNKMETEFNFEKESF